MIKKGFSLPRASVFLLLSLAFLIMALPLSKVYTYALMSVFIILDIYYIFVKKNKQGGEFEKWLIVFFLFSFLSVLWSINIKLSFFVLVVRLVPICSVSLFICLYCKSYKDLQVILKAFYFASIIFFIFIITALDMKMIGEVRLGGAFVDEQMTDNFNSNYIAGRLVFVIYIGYFLYWKWSNNRVFKLLHIIVSVIMIFFVLMSGSRASLGLLLIPALISYLIRGGNIVIKLLTISTAVFALYIIIIKVPFFYEIIGIRLEDAYNIINGTDDGNEDKSRLILVELGLEWFKEKPYLGYGINCFKSLTSHSSWFYEAFYAHNNYIELLVDIGIIGFLIYYSAYFSLIRGYVRLRRKKEKVSVYVVLLLSGLIFSDLFWVGYYNVLSQFMLCIAFVIIQIERNNSRELSDIRKYNFDIN